jgi:hypothetical protein
MLKVRGSALMVQPGMVSCRQQGASQSQKRGFARAITVFSAGAKALMTSPNMTPIRSPLMMISGNCRQLPLGPGSILPTV